MIVWILKPWASAQGFFMNKSYKNKRDDIFYYFAKLFSK